MKQVLALNSDNISIHQLRAEQIPIKYKNKTKIVSFSVRAQV